VHKAKLLLELLQVQTAFLICYLNLKLKKY